MHVTGFLLSSVQRARRLDGEKEEEEEVESVVKQVRRQLCRVAYIDTSLLVVGVNCFRTCVRNDDQNKSML